MSSEQKYNVIEMTKDELTAFTKEFSDLLVKHSAYFEPVPKIVRKDINNPFTIGGDILILKKVPTEEVKDATTDSK